MVRMTLVPPAAQSIAPDSEVPATATEPVKPEPQLAMAANLHQLANALVRGLTVANRTGEIGYHANLSARVQSVVRLLRRSMGLEQATQSWGIHEKNCETPFVPWKLSISVVMTSHVGRVPSLVEPTSF
jgi:hypothetical protein